MVHGGAKAHAPLLFLFTGAEETMSQAAHGFMQHSSWAQHAGAFINLESIGPGGLPIIFQHTGAWTVAAYAQGAATPRGSIIAQDIFELGLVPGTRPLACRLAGGL